MNHAAFCAPINTRDDVGDQNAVDLIIQSVKAAPGEVVICAIAPLTNIAEALRKKPSIAGQIKAIYLMGGEPHLNRRENNIAWDALASRAVFESGVPIAMGTWDVTRRFVLSPEDCADLRKAGELGAAMGRAIDLWQPAQSWKPRAFMYDDFPFVHLAAPTLYTMEQKAIAIETRGQYTTGMTVAVGGAPNAQVSTGVDVEAVRRLYRASVFGE